MHLILASASPRRAELLAAAGFVFEVEAVSVDEQPGRGELAESYVERLAVEKADQAALRRLRKDADIVLAADTAVVVDGQILGKPGDKDEAERMLRLLSGRTHRVLTGISVRSNVQQLSLVEETAVRFVELTEDQIAWYLDSREGFDKAGGYGIQGLASRFVQRIDGSYSNVVGLPIEAVDRLLGRLSRPSGVLASEG